MRWRRWGLIKVNTKEFSLVATVERGVSNVFRYILFSATNFDLSAPAIQKPSVIVARLVESFRLLMHLEGHLQLNTQRIVSDVLYSQGFPNPSEGTTVDSIAYWFRTYIVWFISHFLVTRRDIVYSPTRRAFVSIEQGSDGTGERCSFVELVALAELIGPEGMKIIDEGILDICQEAIDGVHQFIADNKQVLPKLSSSLLRQAEAHHVVNEVVDVGCLVTHCTILGNVFHFRRMLWDATRELLKLRAPHVHALAQAAEQQYRSNFHSDETLDHVGQHAERCGLLTSDSRGLVDASIISIIAKSLTSSDDVSLWSFLPVAFATIFGAPEWPQSRFNPFLQAHSNSLTTIAYTIAKLLTCSQIALCQYSKSIDNIESRVRRSVVQFVEVSGLVLCRLCIGASSGSSSRSEQNRTAFTSMVIFMAVFLEEAGEVVSMDVMERHLPFALVRALYADVSRDVLVERSSRL